WTLRVLLERPQLVERPRVAGEILFLPARRNALVESPALCGVESGAGDDGDRSRAVAMVERRSPLWDSSPRCSTRNGVLAKTLDRPRMARVSCGRRIADRADGVTPIHSHGQAAGVRGIRHGSGRFHLAVAGSTEGGTSEEAG